MNKCSHNFFFSQTIKENIIIAHSFLLLLKSIMVNCCHDIKSPQISGTECNNYLFTLPIWGQRFHLGLVGLVLILSGFMYKSDVDWPPARITAIFGPSISHPPGGEPGPSLMVVSKRKNKSISSWANASSSLCVPLSKNFSGQNKSHGQDLC